MTRSDVIAIVGVTVAAAALIPQIVRWIYERVKKPTLELLAARVVRLGYTSSGPLLQIPFSISSQHRDVIVTRVSAVVRHHSREERVFEWTSATEPLMDIAVPEGES